MTDFSLPHPLPHPLPRARLVASAALAALALHGVPALAQRAGENAVANADDAFGSNVGLETTGIYSEQDTRGFSPLKAGNARIDGIYFDSVGPLSSRLRQSTTIRVGFAAEDYPFHAPTGIVDYRFRPFPEETGTSIGLNRVGYGGSILEWDLRLPLADKHLGITGGLAFADNRFADGTRMGSYGATLRPILRTGGVEFAPFIAKGRFFDNEPRALVIASGDYLPPQPDKRRKLIQTWANGDQQNLLYGATLKAALGGGLSLRGGLFHGVADRLQNYSEIFALVDPSGLSRHRLIADPRQALHSTSGEAQLAWRLGEGKVQHRFIAGVRMRDRVTETGGSDIRDLGLADFGTPDPEAKPTFAFSPVNRGHLRQSALMLGYTLSAQGLGRINLGVQRARYRARQRDGRTGLLTLSRDDPWLYNATALIDLTPHLALYAGTEKGLEDSGTAPESALNRLEQMPATRTRQFEGGLRWKFGGGQLAFNAFEIEKPYFGFAEGGLFTQVGTVRHRGLEGSLSGHLGKRLHVVAGGLLMQPRVSTGGRPAGTPSRSARIDANYRTDLLGGLTPTLTVLHTGARPVNARLNVPAMTTLDLGLRHSFKLAGTPVSLRAVLQNVFDRAGWKVVAPNTVMLDERRRFSLYLAADF